MNGRARRNESQNSLGPPPRTHCRHLYITTSIAAKHRRRAPNVFNKHLMDHEGFFSSLYEILATGRKRARKIPPTIVKFLSHFERRKFLELIYRNLVFVFKENVLIPLADGYLFYVLKGNLLLSMNVIFLLNVYIVDYF